jgi:hypothetical protein
MYPYALHVIMTSWLIFRNAWTLDYMIQCMCVNSYHENISGLPSSCCVVSEMSLRAHHYQMLMWIIVSSLTNCWVCFQYFIRSEITMPVMSLIRTGDFVKLLKLQVASSGVCLVCVKIWQASEFGTIFIHTDTSYNTLNFFLRTAKNW